MGLRDFLEFKHMHSTYDDTQIPTPPIIHADFVHIFPSSHTNNHLRHFASSNKYLINVMTVFVPLKVTVGKF
jgi:hypothetical protein